MKSFRTLASAAVLSLITLNLFAYDCYGAIALDHSTGIAGYSWDHSSESSANRAALLSCMEASYLDNNWQSIYTFVNGCASTAWSPSQQSAQIAWSSQSFNHSEQIALNDCYFSDCRIVASLCASLEYDGY